MTGTLRVRCPTDCGAVMRFADPEGTGESLRHRTRAVANAHLLAAHPSLRPRARSLLLDELAEARP